MLSFSYSCGFNGRTTSWVGKWDSISWAAQQAINRRQQLLQPSSLRLQTLTSWNNILLGVASLDGFQLLEGWWKKDKNYSRLCRVWIKPNHIVQRLWDLRICCCCFSLWESARKLQQSQFAGKTASTSEPKSCSWLIFKVCAKLKPCYVSNTNCLTNLLWLKMIPQSYKLKLWRWMITPQDKLSSKWVSAHDLLRSVSLCKGRCTISQQETWGDDEPAVWPKSTLSVGEGWRNEALSMCRRKPLKMSDL